MRKKRLAMNYIDAGTKIVNDVASAIKNNTLDSSEKNTNASTSRNVILLLIDKMDQDEKKEELWQNYKEKLPFAVKGFFQVL